MSITDELREAAHYMADPTHDFLPLVVSGDLLAIADRIDAEHESKVVYWQGASYKDGYDEGFASADDYFTDKSETLKEHGWVKLPLDADGVPWYRGSRVIDPKDPDGKVNTVWIAGDNTLITDEHVFIFRANELRHYHPLTVEGVLREFHERMDELGTTDQCVGTARADAVDALLRERAELVAKYAAKLRLAGDGE